MDLSADFLHFGASDFPSKNPFKKCFKIVFFSLWRREVSADRIGMAASRLLVALAACVMSFAAGSRKSSWTGCMKAAKWIC